MNNETFDFQSVTYFVVSFVHVGQPFDLDYSF